KQHRIYSETEVRMIIEKNRLVQLQKKGLDGGKYIAPDGREGQINYSDPDVVPFLELAASVRKPKVALELGTAHGLGSLSIMLGHPQMEMVTIEYVSEQAMIARDIFHAAGLNVKVIEKGEEI